MKFVRSIESGAATSAIAVPLRRRRFLWNWPGGRWLGVSTAPGEHGPPSEWPWTAGEFGLEFGRNATFFAVDDAPHGSILLPQFTIFEAPGFAARTVQLQPPTTNVVEELQGSTAFGSWWDVEAYQWGLHLPVEDVSLGSALVRLAELGRLGPGWDSYGAEPISRLAVQRARQFLLALRRSLAHEVGEVFLPVNIAPIADGGIQLEWQGPDSALEVEVTAEGRLAYFLVQGAGSSRRTTQEEDVELSDIEKVVGSVVKS